MALDEVEGGHGHGHGAAPLRLTADKLDAMNTNGTRQAPPPKAETVTVTVTVTVPKTTHTMDDVYARVRNLYVEGVARVRSVLQDVEEGYALLMLVRNKTKALDAFHPLSARFVPVKKKGKSTAASAFAVQSSGSSKTTDTNTKQESQRQSAKRCMAELEKLITAWVHRTIENIFQDTMPNRKGYPRQPAHARRKEVNKKRSASETAFGPSEAKHAKTAVKAEKDAEQGEGYWGIFRRLALCKGGRVPRCAGPCSRQRQVHICCEKSSSGLRERNACIRQARLASNLGAKARWGRGMRQRQTEARGPEQGVRGFASGGVVGRCASISSLGAGHVWRTVPYYTVLYSHTCWFETLST